LGYFPRCLAAIEKKKNPLSDTPSACGGVVHYGHFVTFPIQK
jgi:hypothetical protein